MSKEDCETYTFCILVTPLSEKGKQQTITTSDIPIFDSLKLPAYNLGVELNLPKRKST
jgi:hypothetical protein